MEFADILKKLLTEKGLKQADLCRMTGIQTSLMSDYLNANKSPALSNALAIASALNVTLDELVGREIVPSEKTNAPATISIAEAWTTILRDAFGREPTKAEIDWAMSLLKLACQKAREDT